MEKVEGRQLSEVWDTMSEAQRFGLVKGLVAIEKKLTGTKLGHHGSLYYKHTCADGRSVIDLTKTFRPGQETLSEFVIGPTAERFFWEDGKGELDINRGPCMCISDYNKLCVILCYTLTAFFIKGGRLKSIFQPWYSARLP